MSHSRYWIERAIQDAKGEAGLDEYQVHGWRGWYHHMTMVLLVMLFLLELQQDWKSKASLLTLRDVKEILEATLPKRQFSPAEVLLHIEQKNLSQGFSKAFSSSKTTGGNALIPFILHGSHSRS